MRLIADDEMNSKGRITLLTYCVKPLTVHYSPMVVIHNCAPEKHVYQALTIN